jgi:hypothetical protein
MAAPSVFISYSHKDEDWKDRLVTHLGVLEQERILDLWEDRCIEAGNDWELEIETAINKAAVAILMISANFLTSKFILSNEVPELLERRKQQGMLIVPIIIKPCVWSRVKWLSKLQARPKDGRAISGGNENQIDADLALIADEIAHVIENFEVASGKNYSTTVIHDKYIEIPTELRGKTRSSEQRIKDLINFGDYEKAINECNNVLDCNPHDSLINLFMVIATLKGKGADRYQTKTIKRLEKHLSNACDDPSYYSTALVIWGLVKYDHYKLNGLLQEKPTLNDIQKALSISNLEEIDLDLTGMIKASYKAYESLNLLRFFPG